MIWKSYMFDMKKGTLKFLLNASIDTLPTDANLVNWNKKTSDKCVQCKCRESTLHILNACKVLLDNICITPQKPDIVIIDSKSNSIYIL